MSNKEEIFLEMRNDDEMIIEICRDFWTIQDGSFKYKVKEIAEKYGLNINEVKNIVIQNCRVISSLFRCEYCGEPTKYFTTRTEYNKAVINGVPSEWYLERYKLCKECSEELEERLKREKEEKLAKLREEKTKKMLEAFQNGVYESLSLLEFNFLVALANSRNTEEARKKIGLSKQTAEKLLTKFNDLHLINDNVGISGYSLLLEFSEALKRIKLKKRVKSVFGSKRAFELYKILKNKYN